MNLYHLGYFLVLAQTEHYGKAAGILKITQPSLSHAMAALEEEVGVPLFEKSGRNIVLSKYGKLFLETVTKSLDTLDSGIRSLNDVQGGGGVVELGCTTELGTFLMPKLIRGFLAKTDDQGRQGQRIHFSIHTGTSCDLLEGLKSGEYDVVFCSRPDDEDGLELTRLTALRLVLIVPLEHPLASLSSLPLAQTLKYQHIFFDKSNDNATCIRQAVDALFIRLGEQPSIAYQIGDEQVVAGMVAENLGIAVVPDRFYLKNLPLKIIGISSPVWEQQACVAMRRDGYLPPAAVRFYRYCADMTRG